MKTTDAEFIRVWNQFKSAAAVSKHLGIDQRAVHKRRRKVEESHHIQLQTFDPNRPSYNTYTTAVMGKAEINLPDGHIVVFSDAHYYPGEPSTAHKALLKIIEKIHPEVVVCNGDAFDGSTISRHPRIGWDNKPTVKAELEAVTDRLAEVEKVSKGKLYWCLGNHDARYETFLAANAPQYEGVPGFQLKDKFPRWIPCWSINVNGNTQIKHRQANGIHAAYNNTLKAGWSVVTGHLHSLKVTPWTDLNGDRYGVDTGCLADIYGPQFEDYMENGARNWRSGFAVLTYHQGKLMPPEVVQVVEEGKVYFRGEVITC